MDNLAPQDLDWASELKTPKDDFAASDVTSGDWLEDPDVQKVSDMDDAGFLTVYAPDARKLRIDTTTSMVEFFDAEGVLVHTEKDIGIARVALECHTAASTPDAVTVPDATT